MPIRRDRTPVAVKISCRAGGAGTLNYGFNSGMLSGDQSVLGQQPLSGTAIAGSAVVWGVNCPKPARMAKILSTGTETSFASDGSIASAKVAKWIVVKQRLYATPRSKARTVGVFVPTDGLKAGGTTVNYAWMMNKGDFASFGAELGAELVGPNDDVVYGCNFPKPANVAKSVGGHMTGSFCADILFDDLLTGSGGGAGGWLARKTAREPKYA